MSEKNCTSLELSKWLFENGCDLESEYEWDVTMEGEYILSANRGGLKLSYVRPKPIYPAYDILNDICVKYVEEFWGKDLSTIATHTETILFCSQEEDDIVEEYIKLYCKFNPTNI